MTVSLICELWRGLLLNFQRVQVPGILQLVGSGLILSLSRDLTLHYVASFKHDWINLMIQCMAYFHFPGPLRVYTLLFEGGIKCQVVDLCDVNAFTFIGRPL